jgi:hypothetical protein
LETSIVRRTSGIKHNCYVRKAGDTIFDCL